MTAPFLLALALAYAGLTAVCLSMERHYRHVWRRMPARRTTVLLRTLGFALLALALRPCMAALAGCTGVILWFGVLTAAALLLVFLLPYAPRAAAACAGAAPLIALALQ